ncbi:DLW-39 family protein [Helcobacillus massiliensis]|nr:MULTISPECIES: DLW-39 family protein [Helcobacillus]MCG7427421.1 DLW-39 family protein [Helcobacillus sp. ACRRO]MCT1558010.1 DLW-39 family protein [Helcobacillus massiliensis]MCT2036740.1 DLW-39 family protein [Helcobacillus massiliensis]MCT2330798.1 DLW-39 family protein [Helcobacillus massiliensis]MDK7741331.1 DLW-39 family protein [Helcobacillus massiliensis]
MKVLKWTLGLAAVAAAGVVAWRQSEAARLEEDLWAEAEVKTSPSTRD